MQYSPKLKTAMEEIKAILKKHEIAAFVVLHTPGFSEYLNHVTTPYSCAKIDGGELRFKLVAAEVGKEKARELATDTLNMIQNFAEIVGRHALLYIDAEKMLSEKWPNDTTRGSNTSHEQQNN